MIKTNVILSLLLLAVFSCAQQTGGTGGLLDAKAFDELLKATKEKLVIDVRTAQEFTNGNIKEAVLIDYYDTAFTSKLQHLDKGTPVFVYCQGGGRSAKAAEKMRSMGFKTVYDLKGGMMNWTNSGMEVEKTGPASNAKDKLPHHLYNQTEFDSAVTGKIPLLIDFYAKWCEPCRRMAPVLDKLREEYKGKVLILKIDAGAANELCKVLGVNALPVIKTYKNGRVIAERNSFQDEQQLRQLIEELLKK